MYHSSLGLNGTIGWSVQVADSIVYHADSVEADLIIQFPAVDWTFLQSFYGWASLQYQAWARGEIIIHGAEPRTIILYTDNVLEFYVDDKLYFGGDIYAFRRAPLILQLNPGTHRLDSRIVRDVRAMGGVGKPVTRVRIRVEASILGLIVIERSALLPEIVNGRLSSDLASLSVRNEGSKWINVLAVESTNVCTPRLQTERCPLTLRRMP